MKAGWEIKKLGDVCQIIGGGTPSKSNDKFYKGKILWATVRDMKFDMLSETEHSITEQAIKSSATNIIPKGNVVIATRVGLGKVCLLENDTAINQDLRGVIPKYKRKLSEKYLFFWFKSISHLIERAGTGATVHGVKLPFVKSLEIPVPPLPEQRRIVAILDEAFAGIAATKEKAEKNLKNAKEVLESYLKSIFDAQKSDWKIKRIGDVCNFVRGPFGGNLKKSFFISDGYAVYEQQHAIYNQFNDIRYFITEEKFKEMKRFELLKNDIIMSCSGTMGRVSIVPDNIKKGIINQALLKLSPNKEILRSFLKIWMESKIFQNILQEYSGGAAIQNVFLLKC